VGWIWKERWCLLAKPGTAQSDGNAARKDDFTNSGENKPERLTFNEANAFFRFPKSLIC
jgi:hypothetical protein